MKLVLIGVGVLVAGYLVIAGKIFIEGHGTLGHALKNALLWPVYREWP